MKRYLSLVILFGLSLSVFAQSGKARKSDGTECAAFPCVVASVSLTDQSQNIPSTAIFTPAANGVFRIDAYLSTSAGTVKRAAWELFVGWTDDNGVREGVTGSGPNNDNSQTATFIAQDVGGQPLLYQAKLSSGGGSGSGGMTYSLYITVEQLQ